jgi:ribosomal protein S18 acetylase RimI-like enzyme
VTLSIRPCTEGDLSAVRDLLVLTWHHTYDAIYGAEKVTEITNRWHSVANLSAQLSLPLSFFLVAEQDGRLVGTSKATVDKTGRVTLDRLYIDPAAQGSGIGSRLLAATLSAYPMASHIDLEVEPQNTRAVAFYRKHGFEHLGNGADCGGDSGVPAKTMRRALTGVAAAAPNMIRPVRDSDAQDLIGLITLCFAEYPGCYFDPHGDMPDIIRPAHSRLATEGQFLAVEDAAGRICACIGLDFPETGVAEIHRLYVRPDQRGRGLAKLLTARMEEFARGQAASRMILWSDTRFTKAHALYEGLGYARGPATRSLGDISHSREFFFEKAL